MPTVTGYFRAQSYVLQQISTTIPGQPTSVSVTDTWNFSFGTSGTGTDQNTLYAATTLQFTGSPQTIDLTTLTDPYGVVCGFTNIHWMAVKHQGTVDLMPLAISWYSAPDATKTGFVNNGGSLLVYPSTASNDGFTMFTAPNQTGVIIGGQYGTTLRFDPAGQTFNADLQIAGYYIPDYSKLPFPYEVMTRILPAPVKPAPLLVAGAKCTGNGLVHGRLTF